MNSLLVNGRCLSVLLSIAMLIGMNRAYGQNTFETRAQAVIDYAAAQTFDIDSTSNADTKYGFAYTSAKYAKGQIVQANADLSVLLDEFSKGTDHDPAFAAWLLMECYMRWKSVMPDALKLQVKNTLVDFEDFGSHNTQNKDLMMATARYLAEQEWPGAGFGTYNPSDPTGRLTLLNRADTYVHRGEREFNSPIYFVFHHGTFRTVADFATETEMKNKAFFASEWLLASAAGEWFQGHWAASAERVNNLAARYQRSYTSGAGKAIPWLYYGGAEPEAFRREFAHTIPAALSNYRVPAILNNVANDRNETYIHRESSDRPIEFYRYSYINPEWSLYSQHEEFDGDPNTPLGHFPNWLESQLVRWAVVWKSNSTNKDVFYMLHPSDFKKDDHGSSKREQVLQHKGTLVGVYNIPSGDPRPYLVGYVSNAYNAFIDKSSLGRIYLHYDKVMIAVYVTQGFNWNNGDEKFTENATKVGIVVETADPSEYAGSLANFRVAADAKFDNVSFTTNGNPKIVYTSIDGTTLESTYLGADKINGNTVNYDLNAWPLLDNPWMHQDYKGDILTVNHQGETRRYDFGNWTVDGDPSAIQAEAVTVRARGTTGSEQIEIQYQNQRVGEPIPLSTSFQEYRVQVNNPNGNFKVAFINDNGSRDVEVDWLAVGSTRRQAETRSANTAVWQNNSCGGSNSSLMNCNGYIDFGTLSAPGTLDSNAPIGQTIWLRSLRSDRYVTANLDQTGSPMTASWATSAQDWESFEVVSAQEGRVALRSVANSRYVAVENSRADKLLRANRTAVGGWEQYEWVSNSDGTVSLRALVNGQYVRVTASGAVVATGSGVTAEAKFSWGTSSVARTGAGGAKPLAEPGSDEGPHPFRAYPNPATEQLTIEAGGRAYQVMLYDLSGRKVLARDRLSGKATLDVSGLRPGVYLLKLHDSQQGEIRQRVLVE